MPWPCRHWGGIFESGHTVQHRQGYVHHITVASFYKQDTNREPLQIKQRFAALDPPVSLPRLLILHPLTTTILIIIKVLRNGDTHSVKQLYLLLKAAAPLMNIPDGVLAVKAQMEREYGFVALDLDYLDDVGDLGFGASSIYEAFVFRSFACMMVSWWVRRVYRSQRAAAVTCCPQYHKVISFSDRKSVV